MPILDIHALTFSFTDRPLLDGISLSIGDGERACLVGPNGCGKTTLLQIAAGTIVPDRGSVTVQGGRRGAKLSAPPAAETPGTISDYFDCALSELRSIGDRFDHATAQLAAGEPDAWNWLRLC